MADTQSVDEELDCNGLRYREGPSKDMGESRSNPSRKSMKSNIVRCVSVAIILLVMFAPLLVLHVRFPWTTEQSVYVGPVCTQQLLNYQNNSRNLSILVLSGLEVTGREREVVWAVQELNALNASQECVKGVRLWLCVRLFSSEGCGSASSDDWEALEPTCPEGRVHFILGSSVYLQDCVVGPENITDVPDSSEVISIECGDDFLFDNRSKRCVPECGRWTYTSRSEDRILTAFGIASTLLAIIVSIFFIVCSGIKYKQMFKFPSVFLVYATINLLLFACLSLPTQIDREEIVCSSKNLLRNREKCGSSPFCQFVGACSLYGRVQIVFWWMSHISVLTFGVFRPLKYRMARESGRLRYVHLGLVVAGITIPLIPTLIHWWVRGYGIEVARNYECVPRERPVLELLPISILSSITFVLLVLIGSKISMLRKNGTAKGDEYLVEIKVLIIISCSIVGFIILVGSDSVLLWGADSIQADIEALFRCEARGEVPGLDCSRDVLRSAYSILSTVGYLVRSFLPCVFTVFLVDFKSVRRYLFGRRRWLAQLSTRLTLSQTTI